jgi:S1-C subfamily serine protease
MLVDSVGSFKAFFESRLPEKFGNVTSTGSGVGIDNNLVLTANHVIEDDRIQKVVISKKIYRAKVLKRFAENDVAILQILTNKPLPFIKLGIPNEILLGDFNFAVGYPAIEIFGTNPKFYRSYISGLEGPNGNPEMFEIFADGCYGFSGGGVFQMDGCLIGLVSKLFVDRTGEMPDEFVYAVRIDPLLKDIQGLLSYKIEKSSDSEVKANQKVFQRVIESSAIVLNCKNDG